MEVDGGQQLCGIILPPTPSFLAFLTWHLPVMQGEVKHLQLTSQRLLHKKYPK